MSVIESTAPWADVHAAVTRIEEWLLRSEIQVDQGAQQGGIAGWLDGKGRPEFVYLEIAGYYLTAMAWLSSGAASSPDHAEAARRRARRAAGWIATMLSSHDSPPTRLYLADQPADWRNDAMFSFDLAMAARGIAATSRKFGTHESRRALAALCARMDRISSGADVMVSHQFVTGTVSTIPGRWSTRPGPHHVKAAAAVLQLPPRMVGKSLTGVAQRTCEHWAYSLWTGAWPCQELHPLLYALEGILIQTGARGGHGFRVVDRLFAQLMEVQATDGTLPETISGGIVRSDVLAQALRVGLLLRGRGYLTGPAWADRLDGLADALLGLVLPDGGVLFSRDQEISNTWCALFAHQALYLRARQDRPDSAPTAAFELLV
jgi:hypothetical protein